MIDLHTHSVHSDGTETPFELVQRAAQAHLTMFAIADHDSVAGQEQAIAEGKKAGVRVLTAVELTADLRGGHVHVLGYGFDFHNDQLLNALKKRMEERKRQFYEKISLANRRLKERGRGELDADEVLREITGSPGRPHIARAIVARGWAENFREAFNKYLLDYVPDTPAFAVDEACALIHDAGGITSLAHPGSDEIGLRRFVKDERDERAVLHELQSAGADGIEAYTPAHTSNTMEYYQILGEELGLLITGGTDWHGPTFDAPAPGAFAIPDSVGEGVVSRLTKKI